MLMLFSMAFLVMPTQKAEAQRGPVGNSTYLCVNGNTGDLQKAYLAPNSVNPVCPSSPWFLRNVPASDKGLCVGSVPPIQVKSPNDPGVTIDSSGTKCVIDLGGGQVGTMNYKALTSVTVQYTPPGQTPTTPTTPTPTTPAPTTPTTPSTPGGTGNNTQTRGDCELNFHKVGPLCVPDSPFKDPNAPVNSGSFADLAARVIRILLYFAGIVAVIMAIIGGYQIMTAAGNETQATNGRKTLTNAIIGLVIVILSYIIIQAVISFIT